MYVPIRSPGAPTTRPPNFAYIGVSLMPDAPTTSRLDSTGSSAEHPLQGDGSEHGPITLRSMGSFFFGGEVVRDESGDTYHGDHGYAQYFVPQEARNLPLILWHGLGQSGRTWESTPDGREGFWQIFTRRAWPLYIIDQPRRGRAGRAVVHESEAATAIIPTTERESEAWNTFRAGVWMPPAPRTFFPGVQFPQDARSIEQFLRQQAPNTGLEPFPDAEHRNFLAGCVSQLVRQVGPCVLVTHSHSGQYGWVTAMKTPDLVRAVVAFEPGEFAFPDDDVPEDVPTQSELLRSFMAPQVVPAEEFRKLTAIPIMVIMGDNIATEPDEDFGIELWRVVCERAKQFVSTVNARGGDATYLELPEIGIHGNTHFAMADLNNLEIAGVVEEFLGRRGLDARDLPHEGPRSA
jgi:pimeloyl-ACP methyl ester carboxylesterase